jgi:hypothetical protein
LDNKFQLICDGDNLVMISPGFGLFTIHNAFLKNLRFSSHSNAVEAETMNGFRRYIPSYSSVDVDLSIVGSHVEKLGHGNLLDLNIFNQLTIPELFKLVNKKLDNREIK